MHSLITSLPRASPTVSMLTCLGPNRPRHPPAAVPDRHALRGSLCRPCTSEGISEPPLPSAVESDRGVTWRGSVESPEEAYSCLSLVRSPFSSHVGESGVQGERSRGRVDKTNVNRSCALGVVGWGWRLITCAALRGALWMQKKVHLLMVDIEEVIELSIAVATGTTRRATAAGLPAILLPFPSWG